MDNVEFNLIDEPWVKVLGDRCKISELSLKDTIINAHNYKMIKGELPTQDVAVMRVILAVLHTIISRYNVSGEREDLEDDEDAALERWTSWWENGKFPEAAIEAYFKEWYDRFWLFHPDRPFFQIPSMVKGTAYTALKLNGEISESGNKTRLFTFCCGEAAETMSYAQAIRWLINVNSYDDSSIKPTVMDKKKKDKNGEVIKGDKEKKPKMPSPGVAWLGKIGAIYLTGDNLFETLMMNLVMISNNIVQCNQKPVWELDKVPTAERIKIPAPTNLAELYTLQSRRAILTRENGKVIGYKAYSGEFFDSENAFIEPMTGWKRESRTKYTPQKHSSETQIWQDFSTLYNNEDPKGNKRAGVITWYREYLYGRNCIVNKPDMMMTTAIADVEYGDKSSTVNDIVSDSFSLHTSLFSELGANWRNIIADEVHKCQMLADDLANFTKHVLIAAGERNDQSNTALQKTVPALTRKEIYYRLDIHFRRWVNSIEADCDGEQKKDKIQEWHNLVRNTALKYAEEVIMEQPENAIIGRMVEGVIYASPKAFDRLKGQIYHIYKGV